MTEIMELVDKDLKTTLIIMLPMFMDVKKI